MPYTIGRPPEMKKSTTTSMSELKINKIAIATYTQTKFRSIRQFEFINMQFLIKFLP